ncbi:hypothetical protein [Chryseobacterium sp. WLY505]|uniref:hypothetical protein n=1 Tax=Chryseobacterium sp. WLY505 TaxID=3068892 RepID=UPI002796963D|nr:hypothetical protein [Chryseobacterium sp. WLY505]MDQ1855775.1 hypothetical protein [Chryseobacterium sp. WLY505]
MKKLLFILSLFSLSIITGCGNNEDYSSPQQELPVKAMPSELIGYWKIKHYTYLNDPNFGHDETAGYYISIQSDNKVKFKDPNGERSGIAFVRDNGDFYIIDQYIDFKVSDSKKYPGQKEFIVKYNNEKIYYSGIMTGEKN